MTTTEGFGAELVKACCAAAYEHDVVALLLGTSYHPGGPALSRRLARAVGLRPGDRVLDIASGPGATAMFLAEEFAVEVDGVDLGAQAVERAARTAAERGFAARVRFHHGDAEQLPFPDASFDAVVAECAFCTFPDKLAAAAEMARVVRRGGRVGITDVVVDTPRLDAELRSLAGWVACLADARPLDEYADIFAATGLLVSHEESHDEALAGMIERIEARLVALHIAKSSALDGVDVDAALARVDLARRAVHDGIAGYAMLVAERPSE